MYMQVSVVAGTYVVAVSGGVDSVVLLDLLRRRPGLKLVVAHFDHGIRDDSAKDRKLVQTIAKQYNLPFVHKAGELGEGTSEAAARAARYEFLQAVKQAAKARGIITAHHQDDLLETAILNLLRGSGRRGLTSLKSTESLLRPLLGHTKEQLREYADLHSLSWHDDPTNRDMHYTRNYIRHNILPKFSAGNRAQLVILLAELEAVNHELDIHIINLLHTQPDLWKIDRGWFISLPHDIAREVTHAWLRRLGTHNLTRSTVERLVVFMKTGRLGRRIDIDQTHILEITKENLMLLSREANLV